MHFRNILVAGFVLAKSVASIYVGQQDNAAALGSRDLVSQDLNNPYESQFHLFARQTSGKKAKNPKPKYDALVEYNSLRTILLKMGKPMPENGQMVWLRQTRKRDLHRRLIGCLVQLDSVLCKNFELDKVARSAFHRGGLIGTPSSQKDQEDPAWVLDVERPYKFMGETQGYEWLDIRAVGDMVMDNYGRRYNAFTKNCHGFCKLLFKDLITNTGVEGAAATRVATTTSVAGAEATPHHHTQAAAEAQQTDSLQDANHHTSQPEHPDPKSNHQALQHGEHGADSGNHASAQQHPSSGTADPSSPQDYHSDGSRYHGHGEPSQSQPQPQHHDSGSPARAPSQPHYNSAAASRRSSQIHHKRAKVLESIIDELIERSLEDDLLFAGLRTDLWSRDLNEL